MWLLVLYFLIPSQKFPGRLIVRTEPGKVQEAETYLKGNFKVLSVRPLFKVTNKTNKDLYNKYRLGDYLIVDFSDKDNISNIRNSLLANELFETVEFDYRIIPMYIPNDPSVTRQWALFKIGATGAWEVSKGDKSVKIVVDDTGVDWKHEDLVENLWQNLGEDADGDGHVLELVGGEWQFDPGDINGVDDDGDGYADDFIGWNFYSNNNNPEPDPSEDGYYHGTHVAGICGAVTNNNVGVASVAFDVSIVASRSHWVSNSASALQWAADMGFDVFNMSWGVAADLSYLRNAINYAHSAGVLLVAAAGNDASSDSTQNYPASYSNVIAVAATNRNDQHSYYTNFGTWVDIAAPGGDYYVDPMILSTMPDNSYGYEQGTSMASPMVASVAALVKAANPYLSNDNVRDILYNTADSINDTLFYQGKLGAGRVNAYKAVLEAAKMVRGFVVADNIEILPNRPLAGDTVHIRVTVLDSAGWQPVSDLVVHISSSDSELVLLNVDYNVGDLAPGNTAVATFDVVVPTTYVPKRVSFTISYSASGYIVERTDTFSKIFGHPYVIIVDDANNHGEYLEYYTSALDSIGLVYDTKDIAVDGLPAVNGTWGLASYQVLIWFTGDEATPLTAEEIDTLEAVIDSGTSVFISSQNLAESLAGSSFLNDYLGAEFDQSGISDIFLKGVPGDPIGDEISLVIAGAGGAQNATSKDVIHAVGSGIVFIGYGTDGSNGGAGVRIERGDAKVVYIAFPFEAINGQVSGQNTREEFLSRVLSWMGVSGIEEKVVKGVEFERSTFIVHGNKILDLERYFSNVHKYDVYSITGRKVLSGNRGLINTTKLSDGLYIIILSPVKKKIKLLKVR